MRRVPSPTHVHNALLPSFVAALSVGLASSGTAQGARDTMPEHVIQKGVAAFERKDLAGAYAGFDSVFVHQDLADSTGPHAVHHAEYVADLIKHSADIVIFQGWKIVRVQRSVAGPWVLDVYTLRGPKGERSKHVDIYEVRQGKVVREIEGDS